MRLEMRTADVLPVWLNEPDMPRLKYETLAIARISALRSMLGQGAAIYCDLPAAPKPTPAKRKATRKAPAMTGEEFFDARMAACRAIAAECGENWHLVEGASAWASIPSRLRSFTTEQGSKIKMRYPDARLPAAKYWPGGGIPESVIVASDAPAIADRARVARAVAMSAWLDYRHYVARLLNSKDARGSEARNSLVIMAWEARRSLRQAERDAATPCVSLDTPAVSLAA